MAYLGKEFKYVKEENYDNFIKALGLSPTDGQNFLNYKPNVKLVKNGDSYTMSIISADKTKDVTFTPGVQFHEALKDGLEAESVVTVDGDTFTQVQDFGDKGTVTFKRTFSGNELVVELRASKWDGVARRYYKA